MSSQRAAEIQQALVSAGYLDHASDHWNAAAAAAMKRYQRDHHWQSRFAPDARALIALGLGPAGDMQAQAAAAETGPASAAASAAADPPAGKPGASSADDVRLPDPALTSGPAVQ